MPSSRGSSWPRDQASVSCLLHWQAGSLPHAPPGKSRHWRQMPAPEVYVSPYVCSDVLHHGADLAKEQRNLKTRELITVYGKHAYVRTEIQVVGEGWWREMGEWCSWGTVVVGRKVWFPGVNPSQVGLDPHFRSLFLGRVQLAEAGEL